MLKNEEGEEYATNARMNSKAGKRRGVAGEMDS